MPLTSAHQRWTRALRLVWVLLLLLFAWVGWREASARRVMVWAPPLSASPTGDELLAPAEIPAPFPHLTLYTLLTTTDPNLPILFLAPANAQAFNPVYYAVSYWAWPRQVWPMRCGAAGGIAPVRGEPGPEVGQATILLYGFSTTRPTNSQDVGARLAWLPAASRDRWTSFCP